MPLDVIVLAAGLGKRMRSELPKVLHPLAGRPLLAHVLDAARTLAPRRIFVVHGHGAERVRAAFPDAGVDWVLQAKQLGTGHAVLQALPQVSSDADVLVLYGDVPLVQPATLKRLVEGARASVGIVVAELDDPSGYGRIVRDSAQRVARIVEQKDATASELAIREVNAGFLCLSARRLAPWLSKIVNDNAQNEYYLTDLVALAVADAVPVVAVKVEDQWEIAGVNSMQELAVLERGCQGREARRLLEAGVTLADPARIDVPGALECGRGVNVGAGTITCNYDGAAKHRTVIEDDCFIGSDATLVAPVRIARGSYIGAGSTISKDTPPGQLTVARARQVSIPSWKPPRKKG